MIRSIGALMVARSRMFSPIDIPGLKFWVASDDLVLSDNDPVTTWVDKSGNGNDASQSTAGFKPLYKTNIQNGKPIVRFDGTDDQLEISDTSIVGGETGLSIFIIIKEATPQIDKAFFCKWDYQTQGCFAMQTSFASSDEFMLFTATSLTDGGNNRINTTDANLTSQFYLLEAIYDGTQATSSDRIKLYKNATPPSVNTANGNSLPTSLLSCSATLKIGQFGGTLDRNYDGDIGEILMYNSALSAENRGKVESYLNARWALY